MALRPSTENSAANANANAALFEEPEMNQTTVSASAPAAAAAPVTAVAPVSQTTALATPRPVAKFTPALTEFQNAIPLETIEGMGIGGLPRVTVDLGGFIIDGDKSLGTTIKIQLLSWNVKYAVTAGSNDAEAKDLYKVSYDGVNLVGGGLVEDYIQWLKSVKGYEKAGKKQYIDLWGSLVFSNGKDLQEEDHATINVQVSPFSVSKFHAFQLDVGIRTAKGKAVGDVITLNAQRGKQGSNNFGYMTFSV